MSRLASLFLNDTPPPPDSAPGDGPAVSDTKVYKILFVDDEPSVLRAMRRIFRQENYQLFTAESASAALDLLDKENDVQVVISDHRMPGMTGAELLQQVKKKHPHTIRIMLTGYADVDAVMGAVNEGAVYKFITKPWNDDDLRLTVSLALEQYDLIQENTSLKKQTEAQKKDIKRLSRFVHTHHSRLGPLLLKEKMITQEQLEKALAIQAKTNHVLPKTLVNIGAVDEASIVDVIQTRMGIDRVTPIEFQVSEALAALVPREICEKNILVPLKRHENKLIIAMADPTDLGKIDDLAFITGLPIHPVVASQEEIIGKIREIYLNEDDLEHALSEIDISDPTEQIEIILEEEDEDADLETLVKAKDKPPAIRIVNAVISDALRHGASDIHIEPKTKYIMVRYRIDDLLIDKLHIPANMHLPIVSRIKGDERVGYL